MLHIFNECYYICNQGDGLHTTSNLTFTFPKVQMYLSFCWCFVLFWDSAFEDTFFSFASIHTAYRPWPITMRRFSAKSSYRLIKESRSVRWRSEDRWVVWVSHGGKCIDCQIYQLRFDDEGKLSDLSPLLQLTPVRRLLHLTWTFLYHRCLLWLWFFLFFFFLHIALGVYRQLHY